jgi:chitin disaccharide deacetylase
MARSLIVNADDFGLSSGVNRGIIEAHERGIVTSTSLMVDAPAAEEAARLAHERPSLGVGLHFVEPDHADLDDPDQASSAFGGQLERFRSLVCVDPTHIDSHHHVHAKESRMATFSRLVAPLGLPVRHDGRIRYIGGFYAQSGSGVSELRYVSRQCLVELVRTEALEGFTELACHPARITGDFSSSYLLEREVELRTLTEPGLRDELEELGARLVNYRDWTPPDQARSQRTYG